MRSASEALSASFCLPSCLSAGLSGGLCVFLSVWLFVYLLTSLQFFPIHQIFSSLSVSMYPSLYPSHLSIQSLFHFKHSSFCH